MIFKFRSDGLCSRFNHLWQIPYFYDKYNQKIDCIWNKTNECDVDFHDLISVQDFFNIKSGKINEEPPNFYGLFKNSEFIVSSDIPNPPCGVYRFYAEIFKPQPCIINKFKKLKSKYSITNQTLGFHIRGMEAFSTRRNVTKEDVSDIINSIIAKIKSAIEKDKNKQILIASDDPSIENFFLKKYPNNCFIIDEDKKPTHMLDIKNIGRDKENITQALILLLLLSETQYTATFGSAFSKFPDLLKNIRKVNDFLI